MFRRSNLVYWLLLAGCAFAAGCGNAVSGTTTSTGGGTQPAATSVEVYETTPDGKNLLAEQTPVTFNSGAGSGTFTIQVTPSTVFQQWDGVGAAMTDSAATVIAALPAAQQQTVMGELFSPSSGIGLSMIRLVMGASDFSASGDYSYDDMPAGQTDPTLSHFSIAHDETAIIPLVQMAMTFNSNVKLIALPMSPPAWMKTNGSMNGDSSAPTTTSQIITADFPYLANYFVKFIQAYQAQGLPIYAVSAQNEPLDSNTGSPSAILTESDEANFIANDLGPALTAANLSSTKIFGLEDNWADTTYADGLLQSAAAPYLAGTSFHWYEGNVSSMSAVEAVDPSKSVWFTESTGTVACPTTSTCPTLTGSTFSASGFKEQMQELIMGVVQNYGRSSMAWNVALNQNEGPQNGFCYDCVGVVTINSNTSPASVYFNNLYYVLGHVGKFVTPGANVIETTQGSTSGVQSVGFQNPDGSLVVVAFNGGSASTAVSVVWNNESFDYTIPAGAAVSFKWPIS